MDSTSVFRFMAAYRKLCPTINDEVPIEVFASKMGWDLDRTERVALWLD